MHSRPQSHGISLKKRYGQHFLRDGTIVQNMIDAVTLHHSTSIFEIGCGDGFLTRQILDRACQRLWVFEIDTEWAHLIESKIDDKRLRVFTENILDVNIELFQEHAPWTLLANLPYQVTFPILHMLQRMRHLLSEGVVMIQEEVAQKIMKKSGRGYGYPSLFFQHYFHLKLLDKIPPSAFYPPPKVDSRLLYFKPRTQTVSIPKEELFWKFIKICFKQPRRTLRNNLNQAHYPINQLSDKTLALRAQQLSMNDLLDIWSSIITSADC